MEISKPLTDLLWNKKEIRSCIQKYMYIPNKRKFNNLRSSDGNMAFL